MKFIKAIFKAITVSVYFFMFFTLFVVVIQMLGF